LVDPYDLIFKDKNITLLNSKLSDFKWAQCSELRGLVGDTKISDYLTVLLGATQDFYPEIPEHLTAIALPPPSERTSVWRTTLVPGRRKKKNRMKNA
jgi:hypothetical protein